MGYSVLYIAFGVVALWLLGEVLLQYKARLRWRVLALAGFLGVVGGVYLRQVVVILLGAAAFGAGQTLVTLSYKRGFSTGWALGGRPGSSRRRKGGRPRTAPPVLEVSPVEGPAAGGPQAAAPDGQDVIGGGAGQADQSGQIYQPVPMQDDSGEYALYDGRSSYTPDPYTSSGYEGYGAQGYAGWEAEPQPAAAGADAAGYAVPTAGYDAPAADAGVGTTGYGVPGGYQNGGYQNADYAYGYGAYGGGYEQGAAYQGYEQQQPQQQPAAASWDPGSYGSYGDFDPYAPQPADPYAGYGYQAGAPAEDPSGTPPVPPQPYIPQQQTHAEPQARPYADPYDPYRY